MWVKWLPWRFVVRHLAKRHGFIDPISVLSYVRRFAQPSEVAEPIELLRAGVVFHARGLLNSRTIQQNLDWVWAHWIERQFDPHDVSFVPRAFSLTHINLTHRNWTAIGVPDYEAMPIVDPRGLLTPHYDGWSLDAWVAADDGELLAPSRLASVDQRLELADNLRMHTHAELNGMRLENEASVELRDGLPVCRMRVTATSPHAGWLIVSARPYNPEGVHFIHRLELTADRRRWTIEDEGHVDFDLAPERMLTSEYCAGDVALHLNGEESLKAVCEVGIATAAAMYRLEPNVPREIGLGVPLELGSEPPVRRPASAADGWSGRLEGLCEVKLPNARYQFLFDAAVRTLLLHSPGDVYPGPYTYKRFWFRDAAFLINAMLAMGMLDRSRRALDRFFPRQNAAGYFLSQEGEWDSNGEALWILSRYLEASGTPPPPEWAEAIRKGARWIVNKRLPKGKGEHAKPHDGLLPAGFSAEHLGPNDYYFWDDFWGVAGLNESERMLRALGDTAEADRCAEAARDFMATIEASLATAAIRLRRPAMPASPYRRLDAGAIGSIVVGYPLQLWRPDDPRLLDSIEYLNAACTVHGGFFQDMIHSGINAYLTLHMAQVLMRAGDVRHLALTNATAQLASPTGQWPEAIHPRTMGGCMGDGQHVWAAAEWLLVIRNMFVQEEHDRLILGQGLDPVWLNAGENLRLGPTPTRWGALTVTVEPGEAAIDVSWTAHWRGAVPTIEVRLPGFGGVAVNAGETRIQLRREHKP